MKERIARLYEQGADTVSIGQYILRWVRWANAGVGLSFHCHLRDMELMWV